MSNRNIVWLVVIVVVGVIVGVAFSFVWGLLAAGITVALSEIFERAARAKRRRDKAAAS